MDVKIKDRKDNIEHIRMALNICEMGATYAQSDLILRIFKKLDVLGGKFTLLDGTELLSDWRKEYDLYFKNLEKEKQSQT